MPASRPVISFPGEPKSNAIRASLTQGEPIALRTFTPSQVVISKSAGTFHWTSDGRRLYDYTSGVLVSNLTSTDGGALAAMRYTFQLSFPWTKVRISSDVTLLDLGSASDATTDPNLSVGVIQLRDSTDYMVSVMAVGPTANIWVFGSTKDDLVKVAYSSTERLVRGVSRHMNLRIGYKPLVISLELDGKSVDLQSVGGALPTLESTTQIDALIGAVTVASNTTAKVRQDNLEIETRP